MKKAVKMLMGIVAAGAFVSAVALAVKKHRDSRKKYICDECEDEYFDEGTDDFDEYHLTPEEEEELISADDYDYGTDELLSEGGETDMEKFMEEHTAPVRRGTYLTADQVDFIRFMMNGISNIGTIMDGRISDVERICRRHITASEKVTDIRNLCFEHDDSKDLLDLCISDIREILSGGFPHDYFDYIHDRKEGNSYGE